MSQSKWDPACQCRQGGCRRVSHLRSSVIINYRSVAGPRCHGPPCHCGEVVTIFIALSSSPWLVLCITCDKWQIFSGPKLELQFDIMKGMNIIL